MALIKCEECGKEYSDKADRCPNCGYPTPNFTETTNNVNSDTTNSDNSEVQLCSRFSTGRLVVGVLSIVLFVLIAFQSCAVGVGNAMTNSKSTSGSSGLLCAIFLIVAGIVFIVTRNSLKKGGPIAAAVLYALSWICGSSDFKNYPDLEIWSGVAFCFCVFAIVCCVLKPKNK